MQSGPPAATQADADFENIRPFKETIGALFLRCGLWIMAGLQLGMVSGNASIQANSSRALWVSVAVLWGFGLLWPNRPGVIEMIAMVIGLILALWP